MYFLFLKLIVLFLSLGVPKQHNATKIVTGKMSCMTFLTVRIKTHINMIIYLFYDMLSGCVLSNNIKKCYTPYKHPNNTTSW